jgi:hypothetical protein
MSSPADVERLLRVSDAEREVVVQRLSVACAEGRLTLEEMGGRVGSAYTAVTRADLEPLTIDLPVSIAAPVAAVPPMVVVAPPKPKKKWLVTVMGELKRGIPRLADHTVVVTYLMMGSQTITVPKGVEVEVTGFVFMGEKQVKIIDTAPRPGVPRLHIRVIGMMGEIKIRTA